MASVLEVLGQTGALPMDELKIRSIGSATEVEQRVVELAKQGIVEVSKDPDLKASEPLNDDRLVKLTPRGLRSSLGR